MKREQVDSDPGWQKFKELSARDGLSSIEINWGIPLKIIYFPLPGKSKWIIIEYVFVGDDMSLFEIQHLKDFSTVEISYKIRELLDADQ